MVSTLKQVTDLTLTIVTEIKSVNKYGMCVMGAMVFRGEWKDCVKYAETHTSPLNNNEN